MFKLSTCTFLMMASCISGAAIKDTLTPGDRSHLAPFASCAYSNLIDANGTFFGLPTTNGCVPVYIENTGSPEAPDVFTGNMVLADATYLLYIGVAPTTYFPDFCHLNSYWPHNESETKRQNLIALLFEFNSVCGGIKIGFTEGVADDPAMEFFQGWVCFDFSLGSSCCICCFCC